MTLLFIIASLLSFSSCEDNVSIGDRLTDAEREYLRSRAAAKCVAASDNNFETFEETSNDNMLNYHRHQTWKYEYKKDSTVVDTSYVYVWKVDPPYVYFRMRMTESGTTTNRFLKVDTSSNMDMARNIQKLKCDKTMTVSDSSSSMTATIEVALAREDADTLAASDTKYRLVSAYPLYFGFLNRVMTKKSYNNDEVLQKTETFDYAFTAISDTAQPAVYTDAGITNKEYCVVKFSAPVAPATFNTYAFPFVLECETSDTAGPDANGDAVEDFDPATELVI